MSSTDDAMPLEEDKQHQKCREDTSEKNLIKALKANIGNSIGTSIANLIVELSNHAYKKQLDKAPDYFSTEDKKTNCNGNCVAKLNKWFAELKIAYEDIANYLVTMCKNREVEEKGVITIAELYTRDIRNVIRIVLLKEKLFNNSRDRTIISRGLVKFDSIVDATSSKALDRSEILYAAIASEGKDDATDALIQLNKFKELVTTVFCPRITQIMKNSFDLCAVNAVYAFSEIVKFVEKFNTVNGKLPGIEFRNLLADINIKILESDITLERERQKEVSVGKKISSSATTSADASKRKTNEAAKRNLIRALKTIGESKPLSDNMPMHEDTASDVLYMPNSAELANVPLPPVDLLLVTNYVNSLLSLEKMAIFTPGMFKSTCMMINQCLSPLQRAGEDNIDVLASKIARKDVLGAIRKMKSKDDESDSDDEDRTESEDSESDDEEISSRKKPKLSDFFTDNSIILNSIRGFINKRQYKKLIDYVNEAASDTTASDNTKDYIISALTDALVRTLEERDTLKHSVQCQRSILPKTEASKLADKLVSVKRDLLDFTSNKAESLTFMLSDVDRMAIYKHESALFNHRLIPSNTKNGTDDLIESFFNQPSVEEKDNVVLPKLNDFAVAVTAQAVMLIQAITEATSTGESEEEIKRLHSLRIPGGVPDPISDNNISELMDKYSSLTSKPRELLKSRLIAVVSTQPSSSRLLYPSYSTNNDEDAFTKNIRWQGLVNRIESLEEVKLLRNNVASASTDEPLAKLFFPSYIEGGRESTTDRLITIVDALFSLVEATTRLVFDVDERKAVLVLDESFLDRVVDYLYRTYNTSASAVYRDALKSSYYYGNEVKGGDCPSIFARHLTTTISEDFLRKKDTKTLLEKKAEAGLVKEISSRASDIVKSQIANVVITTVLINAAFQLQYMDERRIERMSANNEDIPVALLNAVNYAGSGEAIKGLTKSVNRLSVYIGLSAARDMLRLSNGYFFSVLEKNGILEEQSPSVRETKKGTGSVPSWFYTALKSTLIGSNNITKSDKNEKSRSVTQLLAEMV